MFGNNPMGPMPPPSSGVGDQSQDPSALLALLQQGMPGGMMGGGMPPEIGGYCDDLCQPLDPDILGDADRMSGVMNDELTPTDQRGMPNILLQALLGQGGGGGMPPGMMGGGLPPMPPMGGMGGPPSMPPQQGMMR